jgi:hypothetical protein
MYPALLTSDLHLTDNPSDEYRWSIFDRLEAVGKQCDARSLLILGDLTDAKDRHSAKLVNRLTNSIDSLADVMNVYILKGNHDYLNEDWPFFDFLGRLDGVKFLVNPLSLKVGNEPAHWVFIPHTRDKVLHGIRLVQPTTRYCFMHHTVKGAIASNGMRMEDEGPGIRWPHVDTCKYYSGDIHVPQRVGPCTSATTSKRGFCASKGRALRACSTTGRASRADRSWSAIPTC